MRLGEVVDVRHERVDHDDELRARLDGDVEVGRRDDAAVDQLAVADPDGRVDHRQRGRRAHGRSRSARRPSRSAPNTIALARVEVGRGQVELGLEQRGSRRCGRGRRAPRAGSARCRRPSRRPTGSPSASPSATSISDDAAELARQLARATSSAAQRQRARSCANSRRFGRSRCRGRCRGTASALLVDDPHHLLGRHAVGGQRGDERARGRADVDVELVDGAVDRQQVERAQGADLVDAAR